MSLLTTNLLENGLFARKFLRTVKSNNYDEKLFETAKKHIENALEGKTESRNYKSSSRDTLQLLEAYGTAISVVKSLRKFEDGDDCIGEYIKRIRGELQNALDTSKTEKNKLRTTIEYFEVIRDFAIENGSRFNISQHLDNPWQPTVKYYRT